MDWKTERYAQYKVDVPEGESNGWKVECVTVTPEDEELEKLRAMIHFSRRYVPAGTYTRLLHSGCTVMSDTPDEISDHIFAIGMAEGRVLVNGLGLGVVVQAMLNKPEVEHVTVVELSPDVIQLVAPHYLARYSDRLEVVQANALEYQPPKGERYTVVWHDIWNDICSDNLEDMHRLHRKYGRYADWQGSWCREECEYNNRQGR